MIISIYCPVTLWLFSILTISIAVTTVVHFVVAILIAIIIAYSYNILIIYFMTSK